ncbi:hypothetical protein [uncultured Sphingomonas sp.]|uniref:hypothetical protein n=1 Tax=uncultured Sphingomonas sp. TaxID=158754 RepID=UPI0025E434C3|nr:hypothetical protein [uncultured Sphingomonas sp.]
MRALVTVLAIVVIIGIIALATGFISLSGKGGQLPKVAVEGGRLPTVGADVGDIDLGTKNTTIEVPDVETKKKTVEVPTLSVEKAR